MTRSTDDANDDDDDNWEPSTAIATESYSDEIARSRLADDADDADDARFDDAHPTRTVPADYHLEVARASEPMLAAGTEPPKRNTKPVVTAPITGPVQIQKPITGPVQVQPVVPNFDDADELPRTSVFAQPPAVRARSPEIAPVLAPPAPAPPRAPVENRARVPATPVPAAKAAPRKARWSPIAALLGLVAGGAFGYFVLLGENNHGAAPANVVPTRPAVPAPPPVEAAPTPSVDAPPALPATTPTRPPKHAPAKPPAPGSTPGTPTAP